MGQRRLLALLGVCLPLVATGCGDDTTMGTPDTAVQADMTTSHDAVMPPQPDGTALLDATVLPDATALPDLTAAVDATVPADATAQPDTAAPPDLAPRVVLKRESKSSAIAISDDDTIVAAVGPDDDDDKLYLINTSNNMVSATVSFAAKAQPISVAYAVDRSFWVALRGANAVAHVTNIDGGSPSMSTIAVGSEPTAVAVSPAGDYVVVADYGDGMVSIIKTSDSSVQNVAVGANPRAVSITLSQSGNDAAEVAYVTLMFGQPVGGNTPSEGSDIGRQGVVVPVTLGTGAVGTPVKLAPIADTTFKVNDKAGVAQVVGAYPNQLQAIALFGGKGYVPSTAASPAPPVDFHGNVHPFVSVFDVTSGNELPFGASGTKTGTACGTNIASNTQGYEAGTLDLAVQTRDLGSTLFPTIPVDIALVPAGAQTVGYVLSESSDEVMRVVWDFSTNTACAGSSLNKAINLQASTGDIKVPIGIVARHDGTKAYVNSWVGREVEAIDFAGASAQAVSARVMLAAQPTATQPALVQKGKKFFWTSTGRWSNNGWGSCGACHADGLADGVTWVFATGPRNTLPLDGVYGKDAQGNPDTTDQRVLNWSAIFDEVHDFENNTRGVSGGLGAIVSTTAGTDTQVDITGSKNDNLNGSTQALAADGTTPQPLVGGGTGLVNTTTAGAWNAIDAYIQTLRSLHRPTVVDAASVSRGKTLFDNNGCANCHAGAKWTVSRRPTMPTEGAGVGSVTCTMQVTNLAKKSITDNTDVFQLERERAPAGKTCTTTSDCSAAPGAACVIPSGQSSGYCAVGPQRLACALRNVGTFGAGPQGNAFEVRSDVAATTANGVNAGTPLVAEGLTGFNPPSLLSLGATAPYLHNGAVAVLQDLFANSAYNTHTTAGSPNFAPSAQDAQDLANYLLSIDQMTTAPAVAATLDLCSGSFTTNVASVCTNP